MATSLPRRNNLSQLSTAELSIYNAMQAVELMPADVGLTKAIMLLSQAKDLVSDFVDKKLEEQK